MKFCPHCGTKLGQASHFCANCGAPLTPAQATPQKSALASDPSLISNIILFTLAIFNLVLAVFVFVHDDADNWAYLFISLALSIFALSVNYNHIDTQKMNLIKTVEAFFLSLASFVSSFFLAEYFFVLSFWIFSCIFSLYVVLKNRKIPDSNRNSCEKIIYVFSMVLLVFSSCLILI